MSSCVSPAASCWRASRRWWAVRLGGLPKRTPLAFARVYTTKPSFRAPSGYATATLAPSKGRLMRCTVDGLTPSRSAMTRMPGRPGVARASRIRFSSAGAIGGRPRRLKQQMPSLCLPIIRRENVEHANAPHPFALLRARRQRPRRRRAAEQRDELAALHSITSSARASSDGGTVRPSALAVLRLITSSILVGLSMGSSCGFEPLSILST